MKKRLLAAGAALVVLASLQPYRPFVVSGASMSPTFESGQFLLAKIRPHGLVRGDVVVFRHGGETMVKRVAYLPGDSIERFWFADEWKIPSSPATLKAMESRRLPRQRRTIPQGHVYVLADNPSGSIDSRNLGPIPDGEVLAVVPNADTTAEWKLDGAHLGAALIVRI